MVKEKWICRGTDSHESSDDCLIKVKVTRTFAPYETCAIIHVTQLFIYSSIGQLITITVKY